MKNTAANAQIILRPRLIEKLKEAAGRKLTLVSAPPGYGKSVLAGQFVEQSSHPILWHTVEARDRDLPTLAAENLNAIDALFPAPGLRSISPEATPSEVASRITDALRQVRSEVIYILDDVQYLDGAPSAEKWLRSLVDLLPRNCHLILLSRTVPDLPLLEMVTRQEVTTIGPNELRLTRSEIELLASKVWGGAVKQDVIERIDQRLEGWPVGVVLSFYPLPDELERILLKGRAGPETLFGALADSMLDVQPLPFRDFLLASSTLVRMTPDLLGRVLGLRDAREYLVEAQTRNLFIRMHDGHLAYHTLFRDFLQERFRTVNPLKFVDLHLKAARYFEEENQIGVAFTHYISARQYDYASKLAGHVAEAFFVEGKFETLLSWSATLAHVGAPSARVLYNCAAFHVDRYAHQLAEAELAEASTLSDAPTDGALQARIDIQRSVNELYQGRSREAAARLSTLLMTWTGADSVRAHALSVSGHVYLQMGDFQHALQIFLETLPLYRQHMSALALASLLQSIGVAYDRMGNLAEACACLQESVALLRSHGSRQSLALALNNLGYYFVLSGNYAQAEATYQEALGLLAQAPDRRTEASLLWNLGDLRRDLGRFLEAERLYSKALELLHNENAWLRCYLLLSMALLKCWQNKWYEASMLATEVISLAQSGDFALQRSIGQAYLVAARANLDSPASVLPLLEEVLNDLRQQNAKIRLLSILAIFANVALLVPRKSLAKQFIEQLLDLVEETGVAQPAAAVIVNSEKLLDLCETAAADGLLSRTIRTLLANRSLSGEETPHVSSVMTSLRALTLGDEAVLKDGKRVSVSKWRSSAARELFFYLLFEGPTHREHVGAEFWPDYSPEQVRSNFHTAVKRARGAVGEKVVAYSGEVYSLQIDANIWCDAFEFETLATQARALSPRDARTEDLLNRAAKLYRGELLPDLTRNWVTYHREKLHDLYIEVLLGLAACMDSRGDSKNALRTLKRGLALEPYREDIHRLVLQIYADKGVKRKVLDHYRELCELLKADLNIEPAPETKELFLKLMS